MTGNPRLCWQERLFREQFVPNKIPAVIDLPTGLGKTMVMAIWLISRANKLDVPTRLIYVVDRRTVVDQATDLAEKLVKNWKEHKVFDGEPPAISTLRGHLADNREWSRDPSRPAIIIGTVDLIGSALLFSGYRSSYKRRPLEAGLLGQDSLLVLDEAHLSKPFEKLLCSIEQFNKICGMGMSTGKPMRVVRMSATSSTDSKTSTGDVFRLEGDFETRTGDFADDTVCDRFNAAKHLTITTLGEKDKLTDKLASKAIEFAESNSLRGKRIVVFVRKPDDAKAIANAIRWHVVELIDESGPKPKKIKNTPYAESVEVLTGTMRGLERDELVEKVVFKERWLNGDLKPDDLANQSPVFLISTSAGEVGFDLNADHLVGDATTIDSLIQRLGRVNRRGQGEAKIHLIVEPPKKEKDGKTLEGLELAIPNTIDLLQLQRIEEVSPKNIATLKSKDNYSAACSPDVPTVELTDILLDAWSMTTITERMPGRPEVGPWLRGIDDEAPQTTIAWRAELDEPGFAELELDDIEEWFDTHRILTHETLSVPTSAAAKWFAERWDKLDERQKSEVGRRSIVIDRAGLKLDTVNEVINQLGRNTDAIRNADLILPVSFGGIERGVGLLDPAAPKKPDTDQDDDRKSRDESACNHRAAPDVADIAPGRMRLREVNTTTEDGESQKKVIGSGIKPSMPVAFRLELESDDDRRVRLVSYIPRREKPEVGSQKQTLREHVGAVRRAVDVMLKVISPSDNVKAEITLAAQFAADWHDHGKNRERWQRTIGGTATVGTDWMQQKQLEDDGKHQCLGKSGGEMQRDPRGYRHEFGSLREFTDAFNAGKLFDHAGKPISQDVFDLTMHLIATHHGRGRPHFPKGGFDPDAEARSDEVHTGAVRRFSRLQRKHGWWHLAWLENLLRCADALASAGNDAEDYPADSEGDAA